MDKKNYKNASIPIPHSSKIAIIGAGAVGSTLAYACALNGVARDIVLYDIDKTRAVAEALDIAHGLPFMDAVSIEGSNDMEIIRDSDIVVITAGAKQKPGESRLDLADSTVSLMKIIIPQALKVAPNAIYLLITNPVDIVTYAALKISGLSPTRMIGSGTVLDTSRFRYFIAKETGVSPQNVHGYIVGEHGDSEIPLWSSTEIGTVPLDTWGETIKGNVFDDRLKAEITSMVVNSAYEIIAGKGATNYAIGVAGSAIIGALLNDEFRVLTVSTLLDNWHGISDVCMSVPAIVGKTGVLRSLKPPLTLAERDGLTASAKRLRDVIKGLGF